MRGRFTQFAARDELARLFGFDPADVPDLPPRCNVAPAQLVAVALLDGGRRALALLRRGLVPMAQP